MTGRVLGLVGVCYGAGLASSARVTRSSVERNSAEVGRFASLTVLSSGPRNFPVNDLGGRKLICCLQHPSCLSRKAGSLLFALM